MRINSYDAIFFKQPGNNNLILATFVVGVSDLVNWAGVPRKKYSDTEKILFQRPIDDSRLDKIKSHYSSCVTPNSLLVTFKEGSITNLGEIQDGLLAQNTYFGQLQVRVSDVDRNIVQDIDSVIESLNIRLGNNPHEEIDEESEIELTDTDEELIVDYKSYLSDTLTFLREFRARIETGGEVSEQEREEIETFCEDYLKPAFLVDGQHRTHGALRKIYDEYANGNAGYEILMPISAVINADWKESVFQFVIINQTSQKIDNKFLSSIISTSLTDDELVSFRNQLERSGAPVTEALIVNKLNSSMVEVDGVQINPFYNNIEHRVPGESETAIRYTTVTSLVRRLREFKGTTSAAFGRPYETYRNLVLNEFGLSEEAWQHDSWFKFFVYLWHLIEEAFTSDEELKYLPLKVDDNGNRENGTHLSLKVSMLFIQDHFINYINNSYSLLKQIPGHEITFVNGDVDYSALRSVFKQWIHQHGKGHDFFESPWKGLSKFRREPDKYEAINAAFGTVQSKRHGLFSGR
ncbi:hypothetical protein OS242_04435 [Tumebacillus sp. DT12]|uniref:DGQHR domain-containing protein n=1 Tax=Tumebacillus lacus TaxID=2995335 RepID=A0ABT3WZP6_9BACL|nr:hypothetical protein [Tumebacillus lacus]MCX7569198.1 hypothetical protein [Tumebacillus lacus]